MGSLYVLFQEITIAKYLTEAKPILPVADVRETGAFFDEKLGFDLVLLSEHPSYGVVKRGSTIIDFGDRRKVHARTGVCSIHVADADLVYREWASKGEEFIGDLADRD